MQELLGQLSQLCQRVPVLERVAACCSRGGVSPEGELERLTALTSFRTTLFCLGYLTEYRHKLNAERRAILDRILSDTELENQLARLLVEMRPLELPEDLLYCVMQHGPVTAALDQRLSELLDGLE